MRRWHSERRARGQCEGAQAGAARGLKETNELLGKAGGQLFKARELNPNEQLPTLAYGQLALAKVCNVCA